MNIFILHEDIKICDQQQCDKHVVKMITEHNQLLSTSVHILGIQTNQHVYKKSHVNHPCAKWVRYSRKNFQYLVDLNKELLFVNCYIGLMKV